MSSLPWSFPLPRDQPPQVPLGQQILRYLTHFFLVVLGAMAVLVPCDEDIHSDVDWHAKFQTATILVETAALTLFLLLFTEIVVTAVIEYFNHGLKSPNGQNGSYGYCLIVCSLFFSSIMPFLMKSAVHTPCTDIYTSHWVKIGQAMAMFGLLDKLYCFSKATVIHWHPFLCWTAAVAFGLKSMANICNSFCSTIFGSWFKYCANLHWPLAILFAAAMIKILYTDEKILDPDAKAAFSTMRVHSMTCVALIGGAIVFLLIDGMEQFQRCLLGQMSSSDGRLFVELINHFVLVYMGAILPLRLIRLKLVEVNQRMRVVNKTKAYLRYIAHEVRSPVSEISLGLSCMMNTLGRSVPHEVLVHDLQEMVDDCRFSCDTATNILGDILLLDKMEHGKFTLEPCDVLCGSFLADFLRPYRRIISMDGRKLHIQLSQDLNTISIKADKMKLEQVLRNLVNNAVKFTPRRGGEITVRAFVSPGHTVMPNGLLDGTRVRIEVRDNGVGISDQNMKKLFCEYEQIDALKLQGGKGSGLGLFLSKSIIEAHGGSLGVMSEGEGKGATFWFELPCKGGVYSYSDRPEDAEPIPMTEVFYSPLEDEVFMANPDRRILSLATNLAQRMNGNGNGNGASNLPDSPWHAIVPPTVLSPELCDSKQEEEHEDEASSGAQEQQQDIVFQRMLGQSTGRQQDRSFTKLEKFHSFSTHDENDSLPLRVLIVDDSVIARKLVSRTLTAIGVQVLQATNGQEALDTLTPVISSTVNTSSDADSEDVSEVTPSAIWETMDIDAVILDYHMPGLSGLETVRRIRSLGYTGCIVFLTAQQDKESRMEMLRSGANGVMTKPFNLHTFVDIVYDAYGAECGVSFDDN